MSARLYHVWEVIRSSFWFIPLLMAMTGAALAILMLEVDERVEPDFVGNLGWIYSRGKEGSRELLGTVAGSMITVAGLAFSIVVVALQLATTQFGPRLLRTFMRDFGNQAVLGTFIGTFIYCLLVMRTIGDSEADSPPHLSVTVAVALAIASIGVLIYFIHHAASLMQAPNVIAAVAADLRSRLDLAFPAHVDDPHSLAPVEPAPGEAVIVPSGRTGYVDAFEYQALAEYADRHDIVIQLLHRPGHFVTEGSPLAAAWPRAGVPDDVAAELGRAAIIGHQRSPEQDPEFAVDQLVEIALRALSPSLNDPFTAVGCVDHLAGAIAPVLARAASPVTSRLVQGKPRVILTTLSIDGLLDSGFHQIRQAAAGSAAVTIRLIEALGVLGLQAGTDTAKLSVRRHLDLVAGRIDEIADESGRADAMARYRAAVMPLPLPPAPQAGTPATALATALDESLHGGRTGGA
jgi:uncharacterized membrane protein